jgi:coenzyme F420-reducing hydrogenase delta subunit/NAD-dependent dihydropyrimidine dehydrogenase PreA subunit
MYEPKIIGFLCTWCSYTGADLAGTARLKSPWNLRAIRVPCSGRVSPELVMRAFDQGADGVLVLGCHIGECHYDTGNHRAAKRIPILNSMMAFAGLEPERLHLDWVSASEGERFSHLVTEFTNKLRELGPVKWRLETGEWPLETPDEITINEQLIEIQHDWADQERINEIQSQIQGHARELLEGGLVDCVIGYEVGPRGRTRPAFIHDPGDVDRLVWNQTCTHNLTTYLQNKLVPPKRSEKQPRVAVVVKPCDSKAINVLVAENRINRDHVHVIGVACDGIREGAGFGEANGNYQSRCLRCTDRTPVVFDTLIGDPSNIQAEVLPLDDDLAQLEAMTPAERATFWLSQFDRCIRCYACRQACPMCYCPTCLYERDDSLWVGMNIELNEKRTFHLGRAFHLAGRCIGCNECERVCPMDIPISLLNRKLVKEVELAFGYQAGMAPIPSPITTVLDREEG